MGILPRCSFIGPILVALTACDSAPKERGVPSSAPLFASTSASAAAPPTQSPTALPSPSSASSAAPEATTALFGVSPEIDATCRAYADLVCGRHQACSTSLLAERYVDLAGCARIETRTCEARLAPPGSGATPDIVAACARARSASCAALTADPPAECRVPGTMPDGAPCADNAQCVGGFCDRDAARRCGSCRHLAELRQTCSHGLVCGWGLVCKDGQCQKRGEVSDACVGPVGCHTPLACFQGQCVEPAKAGEACDVAGRSAPSCNSESGLVCATSRKCVAASVVKLGAPCSDSARCVGGTFCGRQKTCQKNARDSDPCGPNGPFCEEPSRCVAGICTLLDPAECK